MDKELDDDKRERVLELAIRPKPELHACTANGELLSSLLSSLGVAADDLTFEPFLTMVMAHAKTLDKQNAAKSQPTERIIKLTSIIIKTTITTTIITIKIIGITNLEIIETIIMIKMVLHLLLKKEIHIFCSMMSSRNFQMSKKAQARKAREMV